MRVRGATAAAAKARRPTQRGRPPRRPGVPRTSSFRRVAVFVPLRAGER
jgi:hypothetical protein